MVCLIAAYHYWRIFDSFKGSFVAVDAGEMAAAQNAMEHVFVNGEGFNEGYRYVDWLLTVPLLLFETVAVLALPRACAVLALEAHPRIRVDDHPGYPGEIASTPPRAIWGALSTIPFLYILYILFVNHEGYKDTARTGL